MDEGMEVLENSRRIERCMKKREEKWWWIYFERKALALLISQLRCAAHHIKHIFGMRLGSNLGDCDGYILHTPNSQILLLSAPMLYSKVRRCRHRERVRLSVKI
jgi:hypothetical protein